MLGAILARGGLRANVGGRSWRAEVCAPTLGVNPGAPNLGPTLARQSFSRFDFVRQRLARKRQRADLCARYSNYYVGFAPETYHNKYHIPQNIISE